MDVGFLISMAGNVVLVLGGAVLAGKLVTARLRLEDAEEANAVSRSINGSLLDLNNRYLTELTDHRAKAERVRQGAMRATLASAAARKAKAANGGTAAANVG